MLLAYPELVDLVNDGVIEGVQPGAINAASIDVRLGNRFKYEGIPHPLKDRIDLAARQPMTLFDIELDEDEFVTLNPGNFCLAHTIETFNLPNNISAQFLLKSSVARNGLEHAAATWCDAGWHGSVLTLELRNVTQHHRLMLRPGMYVGQMKFYKHTEVPAEQSYAARGRYNNDSGVEGIKL